MKSISNSLPDEPSYVHHFKTSMKELSYSFISLADSELVPQSFLNALEESVFRLYQEKLDCERSGYQYVYNSDFKNAFYGLQATTAVYKNNLSSVTCEFVHELLEPTLKYCNTLGIEEKEDTLYNKQLKSPNRNYSNLLK